MKIIDYSIIEPYKYKFIVECPDCGNQYEIIGSQKYIKNVINSASHGCKHCQKNAQWTLEKFKHEINKHKLLDKYEYPFLEKEYIDGNSDITIICKKCNTTFKCKPGTHIKTTHHGCPTCTPNISITKDDWLKHVKLINNDKYKYPNIDEEYDKKDTLITIICPIHGEFKQLRGLHYRGCGCKRCNGRGIKFTKTDKLQILTKYDLESLSPFVILELIGLDKLPADFKKLTKFGENTPGRKEAIKELAETYDIEIPEDDTDDIVEDEVEDINIETEVIDVENTDIEEFDEELEEDELKVLNEIKTLTEILENNNLDNIDTTGDKWLFIQASEVNKLWNIVLRDIEKNKSDNNSINMIKQKLNDNKTTQFAKLIYEAFMEEYKETFFEIY